MSVTEAGLQKFMMLMKEKEENKMDDITIKNNTQDEIWTDKETGIICQVREIDFLQGGWGNGYIGLPSNHPWYEKDYYNIDADIHGGLTFGEKLKGYWVIGFDSFHCDDNIANWNKERVRQETVNLLNQAKKAIKQIGNKQEKIICPFCKKDSSYPDEKFNDLSDLKYHILHECLEWGNINL